MTNSLRSPQIMLLLWEKNICITNARKSSAWMASEWDLIWEFRPGLDQSEHPYFVFYLSYLVHVCKTSTSSHGNVRWNSTRARLYFICIALFFRLKQRWTPEEAANSQQKKPLLQWGTLVFKKTVKLQSTGASVFCFSYLPKTHSANNAGCFSSSPPPGPQTRATDLVTHTQPYGTARTRLHTVIRGMVPDTWPCCSVG